MFHRQRFWSAALIVCGLAVSVVAEDLLDDIKPKAKTPPTLDKVDSLLDAADGRVRFRLVPHDAPEESLDARLYWRSVNGVVAAEATPVEFRLGDVELIAPQVSQSAKGRSAEPVYPTEARAQLRPGKQLLTPGGATLDIKGGVVKSSHPAIQVVETDSGTEVRIRCAPVRLEAVDRAGTPVPAAIRVTRNERSLLRQETKFNPLVLWLPVGGQYDSSFGQFALTAAGQIDAKASQLAPGVTLSTAGLRRTVDELPGAAALPEVSDLLQVNVSGGKPVEHPPSFSAFVPPVAALTGPAWFAISSDEYRRVTGHEFAADDLKAELAEGGVKPPNGPLSMRTGARPAAEICRAGERALRAAAADVSWIALELPDYVAGPVAVNLSSKRFDPARLEYLAADLAPHLQLLPPRWRTAFAETEQATYTVLISGPVEPSPARVVAVLRDSPADAPAAKLRLGTVDLPAVAAGRHDARCFDLTAGGLACGKYHLWLETDREASGRVPLEVVAWSAKSPFLLQAMSCCIGCWPLSESGLALLDSLDFQMGAATGHNSLLSVEMPQTNRALAARVRAAGVPAELAVAPAANDYLLARLLRHHVRLVDLTTARGANFYNEGLSYHHSYAPSVDRMIRRMQLFTQQTGDYPSFWGVNYNWFPSLGGYVEGGVATDVHTADRMRVLDAQVRAAGFEPASADDLKWLDEHRASPDSADQQRVATIARRATDWWRAEQEQGFGKHNRIYNRAVREVRPQTVCTLFENAGHDENKRSRALFGDMAAACYESYTDFGDWPMSSAFAADWARGNTGGQPVWLTVCWGTSPEGTMKSLFHALARGIQGGGAPLTADMDASEIQRRGKGLRFVSQYGSLSRDATPDRRVALLSRACRQAVVPRGMYELHAIYYHITRLGLPPAIVADEEVSARGVPAGVELLVLVQEQIPLEPELRQAIAAFQDRGGKVLSVGKSTVAIPRAATVDQPVKTLWDLGGFAADGHRQMWQEFNDHWRAPLAAAIEALGIQTAASTDPQRAIALTTDAGPVRYVTVVADAAGSHSNEFQRLHSLPLSLAGTGWTVRDLVAQQTLPATTEGSRTLLRLDMLSEPTKLLALYRAAPTELAIEVVGQAQLGYPLALRARVDRLGAVPVACTLTGPDGRIRRQWFESADRRMSVPLATHDLPGKWRIAVQELLTGLTAEAEIVVASSAALDSPAPDSPAAPPTVRSTGDVHVVSESHLQAFARRDDEKLIVVEPGQQTLLPLAQRLAGGLNSAGVRARVWQVAPEQFDTVPLRWYPQPADESRWALIAAGKLIGYRGNLSPHIDKIKRTHVPELGGYSELDPPYIVGQDCIVFSSGQLAASLRSVSPWLEAAYAPGHGQGRLMVAFSPFMADRQALAVVANDAAGFDKAVDRILAAAGGDPPAPLETTPPAVAKSAPFVARLEKREVATPYRDYSPPERSLKLVANQQGQSVLLIEGTKDDIALIDAYGRVTATLAAPDWIKTHLQFDNAGELHALAQTVLTRDPSWNFPTEIELHSQTINAAGKLLGDRVVYAGSAASFPPDFEAGFAFSPDGRTQLVSRPGVLLACRAGDKSPLMYKDFDRPHWRFSLLYPRHAVGSTFSPDGRYVLFTVDSRPPFGGLGSPATRPTASETVLWDLDQDRAVWRLADNQTFMNAPYAVHTGFAAVSQGAQRTALAGFDGSVFLIDALGKPILQEKLSTDAAEVPGRLGPKDAVGVWMSPDGGLAALAFKNSLVLAAGDRLARVELPRIASGAVLADGSLAVVALTTGELRAFDAAGEQRWTAKGGKLIAAAGKDRLLVADGSGQLALLDGQGKEVWRTDVAAVADAALHSLEPAAKANQLPPPADYLEPATLAVAKHSWGARQIAAWQPSGRPTELGGCKFYPLDGDIELAAKEAPASLLHLVYRRALQNESLAITATDAGGSNQFLLDLPTSTYRVVDIPLFGQGAKIVVAHKGPVEIAECSLWSMQPPSPNVCYVQPAGADSPGTRVAPGKPAAAGDDLDALLDDAGAKAGSKQANVCKIYCANSDVDRVAGTYLPVPLDPTQMVDGRRFEQGKLPAWAPKNSNYFPTRGAFFTVDLGKPAALAVVATYDRALKQSEVAKRIVLFTTEGLDEIASGKVLAGETQNDQFWRLFALPENKLSGFGVHIYSGPTTTAGLSEVEAYK
jgi:hypothetical protein